MALKFSKRRCAAFVAALTGLVLLSFTYRDQLFQMSHDVIQGEQSRHGKDSATVKFFEILSPMTFPISYDVAILFLSPFMARERFWYYMISLQVASGVKSNLKMLLAEPRPVMVWSDMSDLGCSTSFGSPSGHSTKSANLAFLVILDLFFASAWSRRKYADWNQWSAGVNKLAFGLISLLCVSFWLSIVYDRILLGMHTLNQVVLGSQVGIWCALFTHFVLRDHVHRHISNLTSKTNELTKAKAIKYAAWGSFCVLGAILVTVAVGMAMASAGRVEQEWLVNMQRTCKVEYEVDANGALIFDAGVLHRSTVAGYARTLGHLGLYLGQIMFCYTGAHHLSTGPYTAKTVYLHQLVFSVLLVCLWLLPTWLADLFGKDGLALWL